MNIVKKSILIFCDLIGLNWLFRKINADKVRVLMYHGVISYPPDTPCWTVLSRDKFAWQMEHLRRYYSVRPASEILAGNDEQPDRRAGTTVITFDDGLENNFTEAWPILRDKNLSAICFVLPGLSQRGEQVWADDIFEFLLNHPAGEIDLSGDGLGIVRLAKEKAGRAEIIAGLLEKLKTWPAKELSDFVERLLTGPGVADNTTTGLFRLMSVDQINQLAASREFEIGIHTDTHPIMSSLKPEDQEKEIAGAIEKLNLGEIKYVPVFAYPNGRPQDFNGDTIAAVKKFRLRAAVTTVDALWDRQDRYHIPRIGIGTDISPWEFKARMSGLFYHLAHRDKDNQNR